MNEAPIFITGLHKSGTTLLRSLLDDHPDLQCIPFESHFFPLAGYWTANEYQYSRPQAFDVNRFRDFIAKTNRTSDRYGDNFAEGLISEEDFIKKFEKSLAQENPHQAKAYYDALRQAIFGKIEGRLVEKSIENFEYTFELRSLFPGARFIHIVRNPYDNLVSLRKFKSIGQGYPLLSRLMPAMVQQYYHLYRNQVFDDYLVLRYEDLVADTEASMKRVHEFLDLQWSPSSLNPSILGKPWAGNSMKNKSFSGVDGANSNSWEQEIHPLELNLLNRAIPFVFEDYDYPKLENRKGQWSKAKGESWSRYLYNRLYNYFWRFYEAF